MANWNLPTVTSGYLDFVTEMNSKFVDAGTIGYGSPTNLPENAMRYNRSINIFEEWVGGAWVAKTIALSGGGTGASTAAGARTNLGIGSMGTQNSNAVAITGGTITGVNIDAGAITGGILALARGGTGASLALGSAGQVLMSTGAAVTFGDGIFINGLDASRLIQGTVPDARLSANVPLLNKLNIWGDFQNAFTGYTTFSAQGVYAPTIAAQTPAINFYAANAPANQHYLRIATSGNFYYFQQMDDAYVNAQTYLRITSDATYVAEGAGQIVGKGTYITEINASNLTSGTVHVARLAGGPVGDTRYFLRNDQTWAIPPGGTGGETSGIPAGMVAIFTTNCPAGWTRLSGLDNRFPLGSTSYGIQGGASVHRHGVGGSTNNAGSHAHGFSGNVSGVTSTENVVTPVAVNRSGPDLMLFLPHSHGFGASFSGNTDGVGDHSHSLNTSTGDTDHIPPYTTVVFCQKN